MICPFIYYSLSWGSYLLTYVPIASLQADLRILCMWLASCDIHAVNIEGEPRAYKCH